MIHKKIHFRLLLTLVAGLFFTLAMPTAAHAQRDASDNVQRFSNPHVEAAYTSELGEMAIESVTVGNGKTQVVVAYTASQNHGNITVTLSKGTTLSTASGAQYNITEWGVMRSNGTTNRVALNEKYTVKPGESFRFYMDFPQLPDGTESISISENAKGGFYWNGILLIKNIETTMKQISKEVSDYVEFIEDVYEQEIVHIEMDLLHTTKSVYRTLSSGWTYQILAFGDYRMADIDIKVYLKTGNTWELQKSDTDTEKSALVTIEPSATGEYRIDISCYRFKPGYSVGHYGLIIFHE